MESPKVELKEEESKKLFADELAKSSFANDIHEVEGCESSYSTVPAELTKIEEHREILSKICEDLFGVALRPATSEELQAALLAHAKVQNELSGIQPTEDNGVSPGRSTECVVDGEQTSHTPKYSNSPVCSVLPDIDEIVIPTAEGGGDEDSRVPHEE